VFSESIDDSKFLLITHDSANELKAESFVKSLGDSVTFSDVTFDSVLDYFNSLSVIRESKLSTILGGKTNFVIYLDTLIQNDDDDLGTSNKLLSKSHTITKLLRSIQSKLYTELSDLDYRIVIITHSYNSPNNNKNFNYSPYGGSSSVYLADLFIQFVGDDVNIPKNRYFELNGDVKDYYRDYIIKRILC
jgi:hypothetical protein